MASFLSFLLGEKKKTANVAKERLQIILAQAMGNDGHQAAVLKQQNRGNHRLVINKADQLDVGTNRVHMGFIALHAAPGRPHQQSAAGEHKNSAALAMSCGSPKR